MIENTDYENFARKVLEMPPGFHLVELLQDGGAIRITKPGYRGKDDFRVQLVTAKWGDRLEIIETPKHVDLLEEFSRAYDVSKENGNILMNEAMRVFAGNEPRVALIEHLGGTHRTPEYILKALKWIWAQEDVNFPISKGYLGRKMAGQRLCEIAHGVPFETVYERAEVKKSRPQPLKEVDYTKVEHVFKS